MTAMIKADQYTLFFFNSFNIGTSVLPVLHTPFRYFSAQNTPEITMMCKYYIKKVLQMHFIFCYIIVKSC